MTGRRWGIAPRLLVLLSVVAAVTVLAVGLTAALIGPDIVHAALRGHGQESAGPDDAVVHAEAALLTAASRTMMVALAAGLLVAAVLSVLVARRLSRSLRPVVAATHRIAQGAYDQPVPVPHLGVEVDDLASAVGDLAGRLDRVESTRRRLLADVAHELRTPLTTLSVYIDSLQDGVRQPDAATFGVLREQVSRLSRLAEDMAAVSAAEEGRPTLRPAVTGTLALARSAVAVAGPAFAAKQVTLRVDAVGGDVALLVDPDRIGQVLTNLLGNALRHTSPGGTVELRLRSDRQELSLAVVDTGQGIAAEHLPHVLDRFYRVDPGRSGGGSGIGLTVAKALVEAHGGTLELASPGVGQGTTATVRLPVSLRVR
ncbi:HAMP domain-containing sensor histidine kinase [Cellulomonas sp. NPDC089187]|uniref:sensor histidine kinase n=1 Tax=Cellulomonas sp. NPDC089187 TaxID=3154970 RepID=UPI0034231D31